MPQFVVALEGGGSMTVNASSPEAARGNVASTGNTPASSTGGGGGGGNTGAPPVAPAAGAPVFMTPNGPRTAAQMESELRGVGWQGGEPVSDAYARTTGGPVTQQQTGFNADQYNADADRALTEARDAATAAYNRSQLNLEGDKLAFQKAQQAFSESLSRAQMTGTFEGQPTLPALMAWANAFGTYGQPTPGQGTLAAQNQFFNQALAQSTLNQKTVQDYLGLVAGLRGPQDYGQYLRVLASTPQGLQGLVGAAAANQGRVPGFGTTGAPTQPATLGGLMGAAATGGAAGGTTYDQYMTAARGLPPPSQISPQNWNAMNDSQKQLLLGMYEQSGWNVTDALQQYQASLPKFGSAAPPVGTTRLV